MDVGDWRRRAGDVIDVGRLPSFSLRGRGGLVTRIALILVAVIVLVSTYYQVNADSVAVVQRFGRYDRTTDPGPHLKIPLIETVTIVPVQRQLKAEFGFITDRASIRSQFSQDETTLPRRHSSAMSGRFKSYRCSAGSSFELALRKISKPSA